MAAIGAVPAGAALLVLAPSPAARIAGAVYGSSLMVLLGVSAVYHRTAVADPEARHLDVLRRLDHAAIFVLIAGSHTPFAVVFLDGGSQIGALAAVWTGAAVGAALKIAYLGRLGALGYVPYFLLGWAGLFLLPEFLSAPHAAILPLVVAGGVLYSLGALVLHVRRPDPWPTRFGFREVWHSVVVVAAGCHYVAVLLTVRSAG